MDEPPTTRAVCQMRNKVPTLWSHGQDQPHHGKQYFDDCQRESQVFHRRSPDSEAIAAGAPSGPHLQFISDRRDTRYLLTAIDQ